MYSETNRRSNSIDALTIAESEISLCGKKKDAPNRRFDPDQRKSIFVDRFTGPPMRKT